MLASSWVLPVAFAVQMPANAYEWESSQQSARSELSRLKLTRGRQGPEVWRGLLDLYEVLEAYAPVWYSSKLRRGLSAALKALDARK